MYNENLNIEKINHAYNLILKCFIGHYKNNFYKTKNSIGTSWHIKVKD